MASRVWTAQTGAGSVEAHDKTTSVALAVQTTPFGPLVAVLSGWVCLAVAAAPKSPGLENLLEAPAKRPIARPKGVIAGAAPLCPTEVQLSCHAPCDDVPPFVLGPFAPRCHDPLSVSSVIPQLLVSGRPFSALGPVNGLVLNKAGAEDALSSTTLPNKAVPAVPVTNESPSRRQALVGARQADARPSVGTRPCFCHLCPVILIPTAAHIVRTCRPPSCQGLVLRWMGLTRPETP